MKKILFLCHGNICRSPAAEILFNDEARKLGIGDRVRAESAALSDEAVGLSIYSPMRRVLASEGFKDASHVSRQATGADIASSDLVVVMDEENLGLYRRRFGSLGSGKVRLLLSYAGGGEIDDPWYTRDFRRAFNEIQLGTRALAGQLARDLAEASQDERHGRAAGHADD